MKLQRLGLLFWLLLVFVPTPAEGAVFQWTDSQGVIHFTDNYEALPESVRGSPELVVREDLSPAGRSYEAPAPMDIIAEPRAMEPEVADAGPPDAKPAAPPVPVIYYNPQHFQIVVVNSIVRRPVGKPCHAPGGCRPAFRPNFDDRRFIHPSVFNGGSRQYIHPESFSSARRPDGPPGRSKIPR